MLELDGIKVPGKELVVSGTLQIASQDASGETSGTDDVDKGFKAKRFSVSVTIDFKEKEQLAQIVKMAERKNDKEERHTYTISNHTANAAGVRKVRFTENVSWSEKGDLRAWDVSFSLKEVHSTSEKKEQREKKPPVAAQTSKGNSVGEETSLLKLVAKTEKMNAETTTPSIISVDSAVSAVRKYMDKVDLNTMAGSKDAILSGLQKEITNTALDEVNDLTGATQSELVSVAQDLASDAALDQLKEFGAPTTGKEAMSLAVDEIKNAADSYNLPSLKDSIRKANALIQNIDL